MSDRYPDYRWHAITREAGEVKDPALARLGTELASRICAWNKARERREPAEDPDFEDAATLVRSRLINSIINGAVCAGEIARRRSDGQELLLGLFARVRAKSRCMMLRYSTRGCPELEEATIQLALRGLADRVPIVRSFATELVTPSRSERLLGALRDALSRENDLSNIDYMRKQESHAVRGYWLGDTDEFGLRSIDLYGLCGTAVPAREVERIGEVEVSRRVRDAMTDQHSESAKWLLSVMDEWRKERGFPD